MPTDTLGVLQDALVERRLRLLPHLLARQHRLGADLGEGALEPDLPDQFEQGEFGQLHEWLQTRLYTLGRKFTPQETLERVVGTPTIDAAPYVRYLKDKLGAPTAA